MATKEQLVKAIRDRESNIWNLKREINELQQQLIALSEFKVGDKVRVVERVWASAVPEYDEVFIGDVQLDYDHKIKYRFNRPKKDGTMGGQSAGIYHYDSIEKIEQTQTI